MSLTQTDELTQKYSYEGQPHIALTSSGTLDTNTQKYSYNGQPYYAAPQGGGSPSVLSVINLGMIC